MTRVAAATLALLVSGCMTITRGPSPLLPIDSTPPGARVVLDGIDRGVTPTQLPVSGVESHILVLRKECYADETITLKRDFGTMPWFWTNMIVPVVGHAIDIASGAAWRPYPQRVSATLKPSGCK